MLDDWVAHPLNQVVVANNNIVATSGLLVRLTQDHSGPMPALTFTGNNYDSCEGPFTVNWRQKRFMSLAAFRSGARQESLNGHPTGFTLAPWPREPGWDGSPADLKIAADSPLAKAGLPFTRFGAKWDPYGFSRDSFLRPFFDSIPRDFDGKPLGEATLSIGAFQAGR
jgi:hypothetical protein